MKTLLIKIAQMTPMTTMTPMTPTTRDKMVYVIATYSNDLKSRMAEGTGYADPALVLQVQFEQLEIVFRNKRANRVPNLVERIIVVCPEPREKRKQVYYQYNKWATIFQSLDVPICFLDYTGFNRHHSYDQWLQGYIYDQTNNANENKYYFLMEDDYCIDPRNTWFDLELVDIYKRTFPNGIGYLCGMCGSMTGMSGSTRVTIHPHHAAVSNGIITTKTFEQVDKVPTNVLQKFYEHPSTFNVSVSTSARTCPQVIFSQLFTDSGVEIKDIQDHYIIPFYCSGTRETTCYTKLEGAHRYPYYSTVPVQFITQGTYLDNVIHTCAVKSVSELPPLWTIDQKLDPSPELEIQTPTIPTPAVQTHVLAISPVPPIGRFTPIASEKQQPTVSYIVATYSNVIASRETDYFGQADRVLQIQFEQLRGIFAQKQELGIPNLITDIIVVCPEPTTVRNLVYYQYAKWTNCFATYHVKVHFVDYIGENKHHSYDQWIQGYLFAKETCASDYYIIMEDDYCIDPKSVAFDIELVKLYREVFIQDLGYLCEKVAVPPITIHPLHACVSNGIISDATFSKLKSCYGDDILKQYYSHPNVSSIVSAYPQVTFSLLFTDVGLEIRDMCDKYVCPFWDSRCKRFILYTNLGRLYTNITRHIILPVQYLMSN